MAQPNHKSKKNEEDTEVVRSSEPPKAPKTEKEVAQLSLFRMLDSDDAGQTKRILWIQIQEEENEKREKIALAEKVQKEEMDKREKIEKRNALVEEILNKMEHSTQKCSKAAFKAEVFKKMPATDADEMSRILLAHHKITRQRPEGKTFESAATERGRLRIEQFKQLKRIGRFNGRE